MRKETYASPRKIKRITENTAYNSMIFVTQMKEINV